MGLNPKGRDWGALVNWDDLAKGYAVFIICWTATVFAGAVWLICHRNLPFIKIRNLPLAITSTLFLHVYLVKICLAYTTNGHFLCSAEFWVMNLYLPFGIALFQASMVQLRAISDNQRDFVEAEQRSITQQTNPKTRLQHITQIWQRWSKLSIATKTYLLIGLGMTCQIVLTAVLYATTPTLQGNWKSYGNIPHAKGQALCRRNTKWIPSAFWQLAWSWLLGPYILFKVRKIHDVHYWRLQIILSVVAGLPGTPMWITSLFNPVVFKPVNKWFVPPMWLAPGIVVMQFVTIFFPIFEAYRSRSQMRTTLSIINSWDDNRNLNNKDKSADSLANSSGSEETRVSTSAPSAGSSQRNRQIRCMASLEKAIAVNPEPLLHFAATKDFTAENIVFMLRVRQWKSAWSLAPCRNSIITEDSLDRLHKAAIDIYTTCVHDRTSDFPINIESHIRKDLDLIFESALPEEKRVSHSNPFNPADAFGVLKSSTSPGVKVTERALIRRENSSDSDDTLFNSQSSSPISITSLDLEKPNFEPHICVVPLGNPAPVLPTGFDEHVFDAAEKSIKYLVLTNTWQKFVDAVGDRLEDTIGF